MKEKIKVNYKGLRYKSKLSIHFIAKYLGVSDKTYMQVEKREKSLSNEYMDKFMYLMNNSKDFINENIIYVNNAKDWYESNNIKKLMNDFKLNGYDEMSDKLDISRAVLYKAVTKIYATDDTICNLFDFFGDSINRNNVLQEVKKERNKVIHGLPMEDAVAKFISEDVNVPLVRHITEDTNESTCIEDVNKDSVIYDLTKEVQRLQLQLSRYEKLIDLIPSEK